ncbi:LeuA family protein [Rhodoplanes roseus]|uniref:Homocitrate synthase n=1 Tax=Rhodoplanes roseus TaxID=29409 RepID=A0A327KPC2_9BRAD|nr:2-isopropylmalate synthase [Rhodoplanes roseus]RAI39215.1 2-isopropylmalate synthase [Rhodoplanes roseus]
MSEPHIRDNEWWVSPYNNAPEVVAARKLPAKVEIHDATLRDGEQTPGIVMDVADKVAIAEKLAEVGVERIEAGMPAVSDMDYQAIKEISRLGLKSKIFSFARAVTADIDKAVDCGCHGVIIEIPIGYPKLKYQFKWTWEDVLRKSVEVVNYAKKRGLYTVYFPYDTTRARPDDFENLLTRLMQDAPPDSIGIVDTMGCALPEAIKYMVRWVTRLTHLPVEVHTHNDFGMAVATELAGVEAGASCIHSCANGLGERTGNAALEELMVALHVLYGYDKQYRLDKLPELGALVSRISGVPIAANKPILGSKNFTRESGIGVDLVVREPLAMFGTHPALTGRAGDVVLGKKSGKASITYTLERLGLPIPDDAAVNEMLKQVKDQGIAKRGLVTDEEFLKIAESIMQARFPKLNGKSPTAAMPLLYVSKAL